MAVLINSHGGVFVGLVVQRNEMGEREYVRVCVRERKNKNGVGEAKMEVEREVCLFLF